MDSLKPLFDVFLDPDLRVAPVYLVAFVALIVAALGGTVAALASGMPGRGRLELGGLGAACSGLFAGAIVCVLGMLGGPETPALFAGAREGMCLGESALLSLLPAGVILAFLVRGWAMRPWRAAGIALHRAATWPTSTSSR